MPLAPLARSGRIGRVSVTAQAQFPPRTQRPLPVPVRAVGPFLVVALVALGAREIVTRAIAFTGGPLHVNVGTVAGVTREVGRPLSLAVWLHNEGSGPVVIDGVRLLGTFPGLRVLGTRLLRTTGQGGVGVVRGFPPPGYLMEPLGAAVTDPRTHPAQVVIGVVAEEPGSYGIPGVVVEYHAGARRYRAVILQGFVLCMTEAGEVVAPRCRSMAPVTQAQDSLRAILFPGEA